jgi:nucleosome binding factor SPN SPT16 subunit
MEFDEIQAVHFERIIFGIKNFDLALINKDFNNFRRINSIPMEHIDDLKSFFDEIGVIYCEGPATLNWPAVLSEIRNNFEDWLEDGGWKFLAEESEQEEGEGAESEIDGDPSAAYGSEDDEDSESSFGSGEDSESFSDEEEDSDSENLTEQGLSWDELDKMAEEEDRKASSRRAAAPVKKPAQQKRPAGKGKSGRY